MTSSSSKLSAAAVLIAFVAVVVPPAPLPICLLNILVRTVIHIGVAKFRTLATRRRLELPFLAVIVLVVIGGGIQPQE